MEEFIGAIFIVGGITAAAAIFVFDYVFKRRFELDERRIHELAFDLGLEVDPEGLIFGGIDGFDVFVLRGIRKKDRRGTYFTPTTVDVRAAVDVPLHSLDVLLSVFYKESPTPIPKAAPDAFFLTGGSPSVDSTRDAAISLKSAAPHASIEVQGRTIRITIQDRLPTADQIREIILGLVEVAKSF